MTVGSRVEGLFKLQSKKFARKLSLKMIVCVLVSVLLLGKVLTVESGCTGEKLTNVEVLSRGSNQSDSFVWAEGTPSITFTVLIKRNCEQFDQNYKLYLDNQTRNLLQYLLKISHNQLTFESQTHYKFNSSFTKCLKNKTKLELTLLNPTTWNNKRFKISFHNSQTDILYCYYSPTISIKKCSEAEVHSTNSNLNFGQKAQIKCNNSVFVNQSNERVLGRTISVVCGQDAKWKHPNYHCWNDQFLDLNDRNPKTTFITGTKVLIFCDRLNSSVEEVKITSNNLETTNGTKMTWMFLNVSQKYNQDIVTCQRLFANNTVKNTKVKLNILFPPVFESKVISKSFKLNENNFVAIEFHANLLSKVSVKIIPSARNIRTFVETNNNESFVYLYFEKVTKDNIRRYNVSIKSGSQFNTTDVITLDVTSEEELSRGNLSVAIAVLSCFVVVLFVVAVLSCFVVVLFVVAVIGGFMYYRKLKDTKPRNHNSVSLTYQTSNGLGRSLTRPETSNPERENAYNFATKDHDSGENTREDVYSTVYNNH